MGLGVRLGPAALHGRRFRRSEVNLVAALWSDTVMMAGSARARTARASQRSPRALQATLQWLVWWSIGLPALSLAGVAAAGSPAETAVVGSPPASALTQASAPAQGAAPAQAAAVPTYTDSSNQALTALAARWDSLNVHERRALLTEVRRRMALQGGNPAGVLQIRSERRYGRIIRQPDGRLIRIETKVVHVRPATEAETLASQRAGFGVGFEHRVGSAPPTEAGSISVQPASTQPAPAAPVEQR